MVIIMLIISKMYIFICIYFIFSIPPQSRSSKIIKIVIKVSTYGLLLWGISKIPGVRSFSKAAYNAVTSTYVQGKFIKF
jgi:hypothetical protein